ncbi:MAG TPA: GDCCVxC domain-containing (seleno)protein [Steroidobacteraceae bacterium]|nr:GDCCVxC domain-containing (seleno)protein [Steroidobacteraceae bacterium]
MITTCELTRAECRHVSAEMMPTDASVYFYDCADCGSVLPPKPGVCCVFCSYGTIACPPVRAASAKMFIAP